MALRALGLRLRVYLTELGTQANFFSCFLGNRVPKKLLKIYFQVPLSLGFRQGSSRIAAKVREDPWICLDDLTRQLRPLHPGVT